MKKCQHCDAQFGRRPNEAYWQYEARRFCSRPCADKSRGTTRVPDEVFRARYRQIRVDGRRVLEHRYVMEQVLGRPLQRYEHVHHVNHNRLDNRIENLELVTVREHAVRHTWRPLTSACAVCGQTFTPHKTKRGLKKTCSGTCRRISQVRTRRAK